MEELNMTTWIGRTEPTSSWENPDGYRVELSQEDNFSILQEDLSLIYVTAITWNDRTSPTTTWN